MTLGGGERQFGPPAATGRGRRPRPGFRNGAGYDSVTRARKEHRATGTLDFADDFLRAVKQTEDSILPPPPPPEHHDAAVRSGEKRVGLAPVAKGNVGVHSAAPTRRTASIQRCPGRDTERIRGPHLERKHPGNSHGVTLDRAGQTGNPLCLGAHACLPQPVELGPGAGLETESGGNPPGDVSSQQQCN